MRLASLFEIRPSDSRSNRSDDVPQRMQSIMAAEVCLPVSPIAGR
jgi:hypothetical protein